MHTIAGLWMDHRQAVIVTISDQGQEIKRITSSIEKQLRRSGRSRVRPTYESRGAAAGNSREREYRGQPADFHDEIIACIAEASTILIFGLGEPMDELRKRIEQKTDVKRTVHVESAEKMSDGEIIEKLQRQYRAGSKSPAPTWDTTPPEDMNCEG